MDRGRNIYIDLLRAVAICPVLLGHWAGSGLTARGQSAAAQAYDYLAERGSAGVLLFFVISGFVIARAAMLREGDLFRLSYRTFYPRRIARIFPLLAMVCAIGIGILVLGASTPLYQFVFRNPAAVFDPMFWASIATFSFNQWRIASLSIAPGWGVHWDILWSLAVEEQFYLGFPLLLAVTRIRCRLLLILCAIIAGSIGYRLAHRWDFAMGFSSIVGFELIATGVLCAVFMPRIPPGRLLPITLVGAALLCAGFLLPYRSILSLFRHEFIAVGAGALLCCAVSAQGAASRLLLPIAMIGELSYGMYLLHPVVIYTLGDTLRLAGHVAGGLLLIVATAVVAHTSYRWFERPADRAIRELFITPRLAGVDAAVGR